MDKLTAAYKAAVAAFDKLSVSLEECGGGDIAEREMHARIIGFTNAPYKRVQFRQSTGNTHFDIMCDALALALDDACQQCANCDLCPIGDLDTCGLLAASDLGKLGELLHDTLKGLESVGDDG